MKNLILAILLVSSVQAFAANKPKAPGNDGGGGGGFCFEGKKCITLAETGFRIQDSAQVPTLSVELIEEVESVINSLILDEPIKDYFKKVVFGEPGTIKKVLSYNPKGLAKIKKDYENLLKNNNQPAQQVVIYAVSTWRDTYLLPEFDQLNLRSQALILIHESIVRKTRSFVKALKMDGYILDALNGHTRSAQIVAMLLVREPSVAGYLGSYALTSYVRELQIKRNSYINESEILFDMIPVARNGSVDDAPSTLYCVDSKHESLLYKSHNSLWNVMSELKVKCFRRSDERYIGTTTFGYEDIKKICKEAVNGKFITVVNYKTEEWFSRTQTRIRNGYEKSPRVLRGLTCQSGEVVGGYELSFN